MNLSPNQEILQLREVLNRQAVELEHQKRELEIQSSLERVRTVALNMQQPADMVDICKIISDQLSSLGVREIRNVQTAIIHEAEGTYLNFEYYVKHDRSLVTEVHYDDHPMSINFVRNMLDDPEGFFTQSLSGEELRSWYTFQKTTKQFADDFLENAHSLNYYWHSAGPVALGISTYYPLRPEETELFRRFRNVFELAYRRYLDIETALYQARESRIELALERVRARTMAMQKSEEMVEASNVLFHELRELGIETIRTGVATVDAEHETVTVWSSQLVDKNDILILGVVSRNAHPFFEGYLTAWEKKEPYFTFSLSGDEVRSYYHTMSSILSYPLQSEFNPTETFQVFFFPEGSLNAVTHQPLSEESCQLLVRFARVFGLIYRRFLDLKQAERQGREAQIELALERVRARTMAMQRSEELSETAQILFQQFKALGESPIQITIGIFNEPENRIEFNVTDWSGEGNQIERTFVAEIGEPTLMQKIYKAWKANKKSVVVDLTGQELLDWVAYRNQWSGTADNQFKLHHRRTVHVGFFSKGLISFSTHEPRPAESIQLLERFATVFDQTYTRFQDLQKAEAQAREAQLEAALERVRSRSMAMHKSDELLDVIQVIADQLVQLKIKFQFVTFGINNEDLEFDFWLAAPGFAHAERMHVPYLDNPVPNTVIEAKNNGLSFFSNLFTPEESRPWLELVLNSNPTEQLPETTRAFLLNSPGFARSAVMLKSIYVFLGNYIPKPYTDEENEILIRFASVFEQSYIRFLDLQKAEAQTRESMIEAGLERVRSRTLAMQTSDELAETAAVVFRQLISLGIAPTRLYIGIIPDHDQDGNLELWATDEDGSKVNTQFTGNIHRSVTLHKMYSGWKDQLKSMTIVMEGEELKDYFHYLREELKVPFRLGLDQKRRVQNLAFFSKGFIGIAAPDDQPPETITLLERFASVFNLTFTRFNDLKIAEHHAEQAREDLVKLQMEKKRAEDALTELRMTQAQLIHSEKMASLGELTAGIAHEIQNPLNFVNNFSELNTELIEELTEEALKGNAEEVKNLARDIKENELKIIFHGKRADAIVKSMLQHSRTSSGKKEPTDLNALADEYLRLAYHGLRAKDKSFNVTMKTDLDPTLPKVNVVPQDIGRVLLNLFTNAFQAVSAPKSPERDFRTPDGVREPTVIVSTKQFKSPTGDLGAEVRVQDNGPGIPPNILDKIFQPFFTTKPVGEGTGLGLSISYDIIKALGGDLKVKTQEGEGAEFIIQLPLH